MNICTYLVFFAVMGFIIMVFPYIMTLFSRFDKERVSAWRKFFIIITVCYLPYIIILAGRYAYKAYCLHLTNISLYSFFIGASQYYFFVYLGCLVFVKKRINLNLGWWKLIVLGTIFYFMATLKLLDLFEFCKDPLKCIFVSPPLIHY